MLRLLLTLLLLGSSAQAYYSCYEYSKDELTLQSKQGSFERIILAKTPKLSYNKMSYLILTDAKGEKIAYLQSMGCERKKGGYDCGGECDSGHIFLDNKMGLTLEKSYPLSVEDTIFESPHPPKLDFREHIGMKQLKTPAKATKVKCPPAVNTLYHPNRDKEFKEYRYVCYKSKVYKNNKTIYKGCERSKRLCRYNDLYYFGHYPNDGQTDKALKRCENSKPRVAK